jgi:hypothetical protein
MTGNPQRNRLGLRLTDRREGLAGVFQGHGQGSSMRAKARRHALSMHLAAAHSACNPSSGTREEMAGLLNTPRLDEVSPPAICDHRDKDDW